MRVWERGSGETLACGTGHLRNCCCAAILNGYVDNDVTVHLIGGDLKISWSGNEADSVVYDRSCRNGFQRRNRFIIIEVYHMKINENFLKIESSYLFSTVAKKQREYQAAHPDKEVIRLSIGDVTKPLVPCRC